MEPMQPLAAPSQMPANPETDDRLFAGALRLIQPARGHRAGTDGVLLAASVPKNVKRIADLGSSTGIVGLRAAQMRTACDVVLIDRDSAILALAQRNIAANGLGSRASCLQADCLAAPFAPLLRESFDCVLTNPPFFAAGTTRRSPSKGDAHEMSPVSDPAGALDLWLRRATSLLQPDGRLVLIHRADALNALLASLTGRIGGLTLKFVHPRAGAAAIRVLVSGTKGSRKALSVLEPLILNGPDGQFTPFSRQIHAGEAEIDLS